MYKIGLIGYGTIGAAVAKAISDGTVENAQLVSVLVRNTERYLPQMSPDIVCTDDPVVFYGQPLQLVIEAAGQDAVRAYALQCLSLGIDLMVSSIGAFTDDTLYDQVTITAQRNASHLYLIGGALPAVDWMRTASAATVDYVRITQCKPVHAWVGTKAEVLVDLANLSKPTTFFNGSARQAASLFQKSSNITAMLALATVGLDRTEVRLVADPTQETMETHIDFAGELGSLAVVWKGVPSSTNPSTSADVPFSVIKALQHITGNVSMGM